jgi:hypothetical protein
MKCVDSDVYFVAKTCSGGISQLTHKVNGDEYENVKLRRRWVDYLQRQKTTTSQMYTIEAAVVK